MYFDWRCDPIQCSELKPDFLFNVSYNPLAEGFLAVKHRANLLKTLASQSCERGSALPLLHILRDCLAALY